MGSSRFLIPLSDGDRGALSRSLGRILFELDHGPSLPLLLYLTQECGYVRLISLRHEHLPTPIRLSGDGASQPTADSLQCNSPSDGGLDAPAAARGSRV